MRVFALWQGQFKPATPWGALRTQSLREHSEAAAPVVSSFGVYALSWQIPNNLQWNGGRNLRFYSVAQLSGQFGQIYRELTYFYFSELLPLKPAFLPGAQPIH